MVSFRLCNVLTKKTTAVRMAGEQQKEAFVDFSGRLCYTKLYIFLWFYQEKRVLRAGR